MAVQVSSQRCSLVCEDVPEANHHPQSVLNGLLKGFDDKPISQAKRETVSAKLDQGVERIKGLKRKVCLYMHLRLALRRDT